MRVLFLLRLRFQTLKCMGIAMLIPLVFRTVSLVLVAGLVWGVYSASALDKAAPLLQFGCLLEDKSVLVVTILPMKLNDNFYAARLRVLSISGYEIGAAEIDGSKIFFGRVNDNGTKTFIKWDRRGDFAQIILATQIGGTVKFDGSCMEVSDEDADLLMRVAPKSPKKPDGKH
jgi:hypothetical protein